MKIGVVVPVVNQFKLAIEALWSTKTQFDWQPYIQPNWRNNRGVSGAWNAGINEAFSDGCSYVLVINDDVLLSPWTIDRQILAMESDEERLLNFTSGMNIGAPTGDPFYVMTHPEPPRETAWGAGVDFACFMITERCFQQVGPFDENFYPAYFEDNDYHRRIILSGLNSRMITNAPYYHYGSTTQRTNDGVQPKDFELNRQYYKEKWGGVPGAETFATPYNIPGAPVSHIINKKMVIIP